MKIKYTKETIKKIIDKANDANSAGTTIAFATLALAMMQFNEEESK